MMQVPGEATEVCGRAFGALLAITSFFEHMLDGQNDLTQLAANMPSISFWLTDLNVCRVVNLAAAGAPAIVSPHTLLAAPLQLLATLVGQYTAAGIAVYAVFDPHRCVADKSNDQGKQRFAAATAGHAALYPSPHPQRVGCVEVRFVGELVEGQGARSGGEFNSHPERFIDYGEGEALVYAGFAASLGDVERLRPLTLARVDPQSFWAAVLRAEHFATALLKLDGCVDVAAEWQRLVPGVRRCAENLERLAPREWRTWDEAGTWGTHLHSAEAHQGVAEAGAWGGLDLSAEAVKGQGRLLKLGLLEDLKGTPLGDMADVFMRAQQAASAKSGGDPRKLSSEQREKIFNEAYKAEGHGDDVLELATNPLHVCGGCGKSEGRLRKCTGCGGVVYCGSPCQLKDWPRHKQACTKEVTRLRQELRRLDQQQPREIDPQLTTDMTKLRVGSEFIMSEATATGAVAVHNNPGGISSVTFWEPERANPAYDSVLAEVAASRAARRLDHGLGTRVHYRKLDELELPLQFLLMCGPLVDLQRAQTLLEGLLSQLPPPGIAELRLHGKLFTPLEWAAKKGHLSVVEWLCTDKRTRPLVAVGSPIGWACYTGRLEVARALLKYGADAAAAHEALWGGVPPLFAAAQNGHLELIKGLVDEAGQDLHAVDSHGLGVLEHINLPAAQLGADWDSPSHAECARWAEKRLAETGMGLT